MPSQGWDWDRGAAGGSSPTRVGTGQTCQLSSSWEEGGSSRGCARPGFVLSPAPCPRGSTGSGSRRPLLALPGSAASQRLELKNSIFPFSGASAPAQRRERSREAPTLPEGIWQLPRMPSLLSLYWAVHSAGTDLPAHVVFSGHGCTWNHPCAQIPRKTREGKAQGVMSVRAGLGWALEQPGLV